MSEQEMKKSVKFFRRNALLLEKACCRFGSGKNPLRKFLNLFLIAFAKIPGPYYWGRTIDTYSKRYKISESKYLTQLSWGGIESYMEKEAFLTQVLVEFEGNLYKAPSSYDTYLRRIYGDYMQLPPIDQHVNHGIEAVKYRD